ncbi:MAG: L,D-transpeptidase [Mycobacterium sp.]|uniref:L,D-transpeptidase n=1 Tax=Mycobacterium sp. TaxID=1785 RepID=UPI002613230A|nr:L,D-transpeptidase [Mycobacterium sp.]MDI3313084.1 L,D-transpeptidase [Mycobacterium sp.]
MALSTGPGSAAVATPSAVPGVTSIQPASGEVVGVAHPVIVTFNGPVADRTAAQRTIKIVSPSRTPGRFTWVADNAVQWTPVAYWPAHTTVTVRVRGLSTGFDTGDAVKAVASISAHTFTVSINDQVVRVMPASMGKPSRPTPVGHFSALSKERTVTFDSRTIGIPLSSPEGYLIQGQYAVRVTWSGVYVHSAPWSVDSQGYANVSHGCINLSPDNAAWYFDTVHIGDPIIVES